MVKKHGLRAIPLRLRVLLVILLTSAFAFIDSLAISVAIIVFSTLILLLGGKLVFKRLFLVLLLTNSIFLFFGNYLFSPKADNSIEWLIFTFNQSGCEKGIIKALNRNSMIILSFAWLSSINSLYETYKSINLFGNHNKIIIIFLKWLQNIQNDFILLYYSLHLKGFSNSKKISNRIKQIYVILSVIFRYFFFNIGKMAFNGESHFLYLDSKSNAKGSISLKNATISYDNNIILENINMEIEAGDIVFVTGMNKSGKTTLLRALSGYIPKVNGEIQGDLLIGGTLVKPATSLADISTSLRYIVENPADSVLGLNVRQELLSQTHDEKHISYIAKKLDIAHLLDREINTLSGGEQVRIVLASVLCSSARIIIFESPLGQLDLKGRNVLISLLQELAETKSTTIIITDQNISCYQAILNKTIVLENKAIKKEIAVHSEMDDNDFLDSHTTNIILPPFKHKDSSDIAASFHNVCLSFGDKQVLNKFSLDILKNQCIAIMGDNGCGKSTAMYLLAHVLRPDKGKITIKDNKIGLIFQDCSKQILEDSVEKEISLISRNEGASLEKAERLSNDLLAYFDLDREKSTLDLSASEIRLLEIASNAYNKDILIFDEPTTYLDKSNTIKLHTFIQKLLDQGKTILIVTHDNVFASLCSRFIWIQNGKVELDTRDFKELEDKRNI